MPATQWGILRHIFSDDCSCTRVCERFQNALPKCFVTLPEFLCVGLQHFRNNPYPCQPCPKGIISITDHAYLIALPYTQFLEGLCHCNWLGSRGRRRAKTGLP